jgi:etoposide-induced 2.4 mRNA
VADDVFLLLHFFFHPSQASWCSLIAKRTFTLRHGLAYPYVGMTSTTSPNAYIAFLNSLATSAYRAVMIATCVFISFALGYVPVVGGMIETVFFCWVDA